MRRETRARARHVDAADAHCRSRSLVEESCTAARIESLVPITRMATEPGGGSISTSTRTFGGRPGPWER